MWKGESSWLKGKKSDAEVAKSYSKNESSMHMKLWGEKKILCWFCLRTSNCKSHSHSAWQVLRYNGKGIEFVYMWTGKSTIHMWFGTLGIGHPLGFWNASPVDKGRSVYEPSLLCGFLFLLLHDCIQKFILLTLQYLGVKYHEMKCKC
jgi:hypothetical protein